MTDEQAAENLRKILRSPSYRVAYKDVDFLTGPKLRAARMELELLKPELAFQKQHIRSTIVVFGSTRIVEPSLAREELERAETQLAETPDDPRCERAVVRRGGSRPSVATTNSPGSLPNWSPRAARCKETATTSSSPAGGRGSWRRPTAGRSTWGRSRSV